MLARRLTPVLAAVALAGLAATACAEQSAAVRVGDQVYSEADMIAELDAFGDNPALQDADDPRLPQMSGELAQSYDQQFVGEMVRRRIEFLVGRQLFADEGLELTEELRAAGAQQVANDYALVVDGFPDDYRLSLGDDYARLVGLQDELGSDGLREAFTEAIRTLEISVSSRFGCWDADGLSVVAPAGPELPRIEGGSADSGSEPRNCADRLG